MGVSGQHPAAPPRRPRDGWRCAAAADFLAFLTGQSPWAILRCRAVNASPTDFPVLPSNTSPSSGTISGRILRCGQLFPQFLRGQSEELPEAQVGQLQPQQAVGRLILAAADAKAT